MHKFICIILIILSLSPHYTLTRVNILGNMLLLCSSFALLNSPTFGSIYSNSIPLTRSQFHPKKIILDQTFSLFSEELCLVLFCKQKNPYSSQVTISFLKLPFLILFCTIPTSQSIIPFDGSSFSHNKAYPHLKQDPKHIKIEINQNEKQIRI